MGIKYGSRFDCKRKSHIAAENSDTKKFFWVLRSDSKVDSDIGGARDGFPLWLNSPESNFG